MLTKEECEKAIDNVARYCSDYKHYMIPPRFELINELDVLMSLIQEHFELVELLKPHGYGMLSAEEFEHWISYICKHNADNDMIIMSQNEQLEQIKNPQPYKFENLKVGMWVWDDEERECRKILETYVTGEDNDVYVKGVRIVRHGLHELSWKYSVFKEGRFFPPTKAMEYQE